MTVGDNTIKAKNLGDFFKNLERKELNVSEKMAKNVLGNPGRALDLTVNCKNSYSSCFSKFQTGPFNTTRIDNFL